MSDHVGSSSRIGPEAQPAAGGQDENLPEPDNSPLPMGPTITVSLSIRALVPDWDAAAVAVAMRMVDRLQVYEQYVTYWQARPQVCAPSSSCCILSSLNGSFFCLTCY